MCPSSLFPDAYSSLLLSSSAMTLLYIGTEHALHWGRFELLEGAAPKMNWLGRLEIGDMPSFLAFSPHKRAVAVVEGSDRVVSLTVDADGGLELSSTQPCPGGPAYVSLSRDGRWAFIASYGSGQLRVFPLRNDGKLAECTCVVETGRHSHCAVLDSASSRVYVPSKGTDSVYVGRFDDESGRVTTEGIVRTPSGTGPRHLVIAADVGQAYLANENDSSLIVFRQHDEAPFLSVLRHVSATPAQLNATDSGADVHVSGDGRFVYMTVRGQDDVAVFDRDRDFQCIQHASTLGQVPRNFCLLKDSLLVVANQESKSLTFFSRDEQRGTLTALGQVAMGERPFWVGNSNS